MIVVEDVVGKEMSNRELSPWKCTVCGDWVYDYPFCPRCLKNAK